MYCAVDVVSLDESVGSVNNSPFINAIVKQALLTPAYIYSLENKTTNDFSYFANNINIAVEDDVYHPAYDGFRLSELQLCRDIELSLIVVETAQYCRVDSVQFKYILQSPHSIVE